MRVVVAELLVVMMVEQEEMTGHQRSVTQMMAVRALEVVVRW